MINFTAETITSNFVLGKTGEHNATQLTITPPAELSGEVRTDHYRVAFFSAGKTYLSAAKTGATFNVALSSDVTKSPNLSLQVIAYDDEGEFIGKSKRVDGFSFEPSISGTAIEIDGENNDIANEIVNISDSLDSVESSLTAEIARATAKENQLDSGKVDKISGKGLSTNDFTNAEKQKLSSLENYNDAGILARLSYAEDDITDLETGKVDKVSGKALSSNDYTNSEREKLASLHGRVFFGTCSTNANVATKVVTTDSDFSLMQGTVIVVSFNNASGGDNYSPRYLNVNSSGAKRIASKNSIYLDSWEPFVSNSVVSFVFCNDRWIQTDVFYADSDDFGHVKLSDSVSSNMDASYSVAASPKAVYTVNNKAESLFTKTNLTDKKLDYLSKLTKGQAWDTEIDNGIAISKSVPQGAKCVSINKIGGKSILFNQLVNSNDFPSTQTKYGVTFTNNGDGTITADGTATADIVYTLISLVDSDRSGHKIAMCGCPSGGSNSSYKLVESWNGPSDVGGGVISKVSVSGKIRIDIKIINGTTVSGLAFTPQYFDLTDMLGSGNEPSTFAEFRNIIPAGYYEYEAGELMNSYCGSIVSKDSSNNVIASYTIPSALLSVILNEGYGQSNGSTYNYIDFEQKKYYKFGSYSGDSWVANERIINISQYLFDDNILSVSDGGKLLFTGGSGSINFPFMSEIEYAVNLSEATE